MYAVPTGPVQVDAARLADLAAWCWAVAGWPAAAGWADAQPARATAVSATAEPVIRAWCLVQADMSDHAPSEFRGRALHRLDSRRLDREALAGTGNWRQLELEYLVLRRLQLGGGLWQPGEPAEPEPAAGPERAGEVARGLPPP